MLILAALRAGEVLACAYALVILQKQKLIALTHLLHLVGQLLAHPYGSFHIFLLFVDSLRYVSVLLKFGFQFIIFNLKRFLLLLHLRNYLQSIINQLSAYRVLFVGDLLLLELRQLLFGLAQLCGQSRYLLLGLERIIWCSGYELSLQLGDFFLVLLIYAVDLFLFSILPDLVEVRQQLIY